MIDKIRTPNQYDQVMKMIENFLQKATEGGGFHTLKKKEADELERLTLLAEKYEDNTLKIMPLPESLGQIVTIKMEEMNITQKGLAEILEIGAPKLNQIIKGKREPDVPFLKAIHEKLGIDGNVILEKV